MADARASELGPGVSPYDTHLSSALRFLVELVTWIAGPWAAADATGQWWVAIPVAIVLLALPAVFSTLGDKHQVIVATPGAVRLTLELVLWAVAIAGAWVVWPVWAVVFVTVLVAAASVTGLSRARWLLQGAPLDE